MKNIYLLIFVLVLVGCQTSKKETTKEDNSYTIFGTIEGAPYNDFIYMLHKGHTDSVQVKDNKFKFTGIVDKPEEASLRLKYISTAEWFYIDKGTSELKMHWFLNKNEGYTVNFIKLDTILGSHSYEIMKEYQNFYQTNKNKSNFSELLYHKLSKYYDENKSHPFSGFILSRLAMDGASLSPVQLTNLYNKLDTLQQDSMYLSNIRRGIKKSAMFGKGQPFLAVNLPNMAGDETTLKYPKGKLTLVELWESSCGPCRIELNYLRETLKEKDLDNLQIVGISIDKDKKAWKDAVIASDYSWLNLLDDKGEINDALMLDYTGIPTNYLLDENGEIIGTEVTLEKVEELVGTYPN